MPKDNIYTLPEVQLTNINYGFFSNEDGESDAGYLIKDKKTRNVNIYSSEQAMNSGFDPANRVLANIQKCFQDLGAESNPHSHKFFMTSYYANNGKSEPLIISCDNLEGLNQLKALGKENLTFETDDKSDPNRLGLEPTMRAALKESDITVLRADALIFRGIPGESIAVLGASGDAHPIMLFDEENKIACYLSGAHASIKQGVLEKSVQKMISLGANPNAIRVVIGPGLGPKSYEFGENAPEYFGLENSQALKPVQDISGNKKYLVNIHEIVRAKLKDKIVPEHIFNLDIDTMAFELYVEGQNDQRTALHRRATINFKELNENGPLFFGARRGIMEKNNDLMQHNPGTYNTIGRHGAGFMVTL